jgi:site-specific recombinase XerD
MPKTRHAFQRRRPCACGDLALANTPLQRVTEALQAELLEHHKANGVGQRVFTSAYSAFREGVDRAELGLPKGQLSHVLRHTFASHFMMSGGNILALQKALGHQSLNVTMRYAHLSPDHLAETRTLNPLATMPA